MSKLKVKLWHIKLPEKNRFADIEGTAHELNITIFEHTEEVVGDWGYTSTVNEIYFLHYRDASDVAFKLKLNPDKCVKWKHAFFKAKFEFE